MAREVRPGKYTLRDYHFEMPHKALEASRPGTLPPGAAGRLEVYDYPGEYAKRFNQPRKRTGDVLAEGQKLAKLRMEEEETPHLVITGSSNCRTFAAGCKFDLFNHPVAAVNATYALTAEQHSAVQDLGFVSGGGSTGSYSNSFTCIPLRSPFRPPRLTPKPVVQGPQTAVVVGIKGEEIQVDDFGRVKVQFPWDREGKKDENSSCWVRVAQFWAGKRWGASFWPRIGQEVIVDFLEGDPDQPIVVGSVYNAEQMPPYLGDGPDGKHRHDPKLSGIKTCSTPGGNGFNEIRFDDNKGKEQLFFRAENTMDVHVNGSQQISVGGDRNLTVGGGLQERIEAHKDVHVIGPMRTLCAGDYGLKVNGEFNQKVEGRSNFGARGDSVIGSGASLTLIGTDVLRLTCGGSFIKIAPGGIWIESENVYINSGGDVGPKPAPPPLGAPEESVGADDAVTGFPSAPGAKIGSPRPKPAPASRPAAPPAAEGPTRPASPPPSPEGPTRPASSPSSPGAGGAAGGANGGPEPTRPGAPPLSPDGPTRLASSPSSPGAGGASAGANGEPEPT